MKAEEPGVAVIMEHFLPLSKCKIIPLPPRKKKVTRRLEKLLLWENKIKNNYSFGARAKTIIQLLPSAEASD